MSDTLKIILQTTIFILGAILGAQNVNTNQKINEINAKLRTSNLSTPQMASPLSLPLPERKKP